MDFAENAVMTKVRALYGKRLSASDYEQLIQKKSVGEIASYLAKETYYDQNLREVKEDLIHREQLEHLVRRHSLDIYTRLLKYARGDRLFLSMYVMQQEIEQILIVVRLLNSGQSGRYIVELPVYLAKLMSFDLFEMAKIRSYDDLLAILERSEYLRIANRFRPARTGKLVDITSLEAALLTHYYNKLLDIARCDYRGDTRRDLTRLLQFRVALHNCMVIYRMRRYLGAEEDLIRPRLAQVELPGSERIYQRLLEAPGMEELYRQMNRLRILRRNPVDWEQSSTQTGNHLARVREELHRKLFRMSTKPPVVVASYMTLLDIEISNVIHIIEGIRYGIASAEIRSLLVL